MVKSSGSVLLSQDIGIHLVFFVAVEETGGSKLLVSFVL